MKDIANKAECHVWSMIFSYLTGITTIMFCKALFDIDKAQSIKAATDAWMVAGATLFGAIVFAVIAVLLFLISNVKHNH